MKKRYLLLLTFVSLSLIGCKTHTHEFGDWKQSKVATCIEKGEEQRICSCGEIETREIQKTGHIEVIDEEIKATCLEGGKTEGKHCSVCGEIIVAQTDVEKNEVDLISIG